MPSFNHKPKGSLIGSGSYKFRHYGNEVRLIRMRITGDGYAYDKYVVGVTLYGTTQYYGDKSYDVGIGTHVGLFYNADNHVLRLNGVAYRGEIPAEVELTDTTTFDLSGKAEASGDSSIVYTGTINIASSVYKDFNTSGHNGILALSSYYWSVNDYSKEYADGTQYIFQNDTVQVYAKTGVTINGTSYGGNKKSFRINSGTPTIVFSDTGSIFSRKYYVEVSGDVTVLQ